VCGLEIDVPFVTMYHDMQHRFILFFSPWDDETHHYAEIPIIDKAGFEGYIFRSVYGINQLREKIAILESGLDDVAVERMKFFLYLDPMSELRCDDKVYFIGINMNSETAQVARMKRGAIQFARIRQGVKPNIMTYPMELYYDYLLAVQKDPRMTIATCACIDNGWIRYKLQQMS
jgi:hypothetical protein